MAWPEEPQEAPTRSIFDPAAPPIFNPAMPGSTPAVPLSAPAVPLSTPASTLPAPRPGGRSLFDPTPDPTASALRAAADITPDTAARVVRVVNQTGLPYELVQRNLEQLERDVAQTHFDAGAFRAKSPLLAEWLQAHPLNPALAQDDLGVLGQIEYTLRSTTDAIWSMVGGGSARATPTRANPAAQALDVAATSARSAVGGIYGGMELGTWGALRLLGDLTGSPGILKFVEQAERESTLGQEQIAGVPAEAGPNLQAFYSGWQSVGSTLPILATQVLGGPAASTFALRLMGLQTGGKAYSQARDAGHGILPSLVFGGSQGAIEMATEARPVWQMAEDLVRKSGLFKLIGHQLLEEIPGELIATTLQNLNEWATLHEGEPFSTYVESLPRAWLDTLIATSVAVVAQSGGAHLLNRAVAGVVGQRTLEDMGEQTKASKLATRSPEAYAAYVASVVKDSPIETVYAPLATWDEYWQSRNVNPAAAAAEVTGDAEAYAHAQQTKTDLPIPFAQYARYLAGTEHNAYFAKEVRIDPDAATGRQSADLAEWVKTLPMPAAQPVSALRTAVVAQLVKAGVPESQAADYGRFADVVTTLSNRVGVDLQAKHNYGITVARPDLGVTPAAAAAVEPSADVAGTSAEPVADVPAVPDSVLSAFPDMREAEGGLLPLTAGFTAEEQAALRAAGLVESATTSTGETYEGVDPHKLWPLRQQRAAEQMKDLQARAAAREAAAPEAVAAKIRALMRARAGGVVDTPAAEAQTEEVAADETPSPAAAGEPGTRAEPVDRGEEQPAADGGARADEGRGDGARAERRRFPPPDVDEVFTRADPADTARRLTPTVTRELDRIREELETFGFVKRTWNWLTGKITGTHAGGHADVAPGSAGTPVYDDILYFAPANRVTSGARKGQAARETHGSRQDVLDAVRRLLATGDAHNNLAEGALRVAERREAGDYTDLNTSWLPPTWGPVAPAPVTDAVSDAIDAALAPEADYLADESAVTDADLETEGDTSFNIDEFNQSLFDEPEEEAPVVDTLDTGEPQTRLPGPVGEVRDTEVATPTFEAPFSLTAPVPKNAKGKQTTLFQGPLKTLRSIEPHLLPEEEAKLRRDTRARLIAFFGELPPDLDYMDVAEAGRIKRGWYQKSAQALRDVFGKRDAPRFAALLAAMSPQVGVPENLRNAVATWGNWKAAGRPTDRAAIVAILARSVQGTGTEASVLKSWINNSVTALTAKNARQIVLSGPKVHSFYQNLIDNVLEVTNDAWMANFANIAQKVFAGKRNVAGTDPGKGPGYKASSAKIRRVAAKLTARTGETWTPAEVQETVWSWARTLYLLATKTGRSAVDVLKSGLLTDEAIRGTPDFQTLLHANSTIRGMLSEAGYGKELDRLERESRRALGTGPTAERGGGGGVRPEAAPGRPDTEPTLGELRSARRLDQLRADRAAKGQVVTEYDQSPIEPIDAGVTQANLDIWTDDIRRRAGSDLVAFDLRLQRNGDILLETLAVKRGATKQGLGSKVVLELTRLADLNGRRLVLSVGRKGFTPVAGSATTTSANRLIAFYRRFGFVENTGRRKDFTIRDRMYREPTAPSPALGPQIESPAFRAWFGDSQVVDSAGAPLVVYHGTARGDRVADVFRKDRATSGPMAFFTTDPAIAEKYSTGKADTSLDVPEDYGGWFKFRIPGTRSEVTLDRAWFHLTPAERAMVIARLPTVGYEQPDTGEGAIIQGSSSITGADHIAYLLRDQRGNGLAAAKELWLSSGSLFDQEERFLEVLAGLGLTGRFRLDSPYQTHPKVYHVYLAIENPLITNAIPASVVDALAERAARERPSTELPSGDLWDKRDRNPAHWMAELVKDLGTGKNSFVWSSIPDWVTETLQDLGYDGIHDTGGKMGGAMHDVWIPFEPTQIKSATENRGTFDPHKASILYQDAPATPPFYSRLMRAVEMSLQARASGAQWKATIRNAKIGINESEFALVHVADLEDRTVYTKADVLTYLQTHAVEVEDVVLGETPGGPTEDEIHAAAEELYHERINALREREQGAYYDAMDPASLRVTTRFDEAQGQWEAFVGGEDLNEWYDTEDEAEAAADSEAEDRRQRYDDMMDEERDQEIRNAVDFGEALDDARRELERDRDADQDTQYAEYVLPGGEEGSYREVFLTVPTQPKAQGPAPDIRIHTQHPPGNVGFVRYTVTVNGRLWMSDLTHDARELYIEQARADEPTMLAYAQEVWQRTAAQERRAAMPTWEDGHEAYSGIENPIVRLRFNTRTVGTERVLFLEEVQPPLASEQEKMPELFTKNWREIAFKWALHYGATNGFDAVAWTPGQVQADRYSLEKEVREITWRRMLGGPVRGVGITTVSGHEIMFDVDAQGRIKKEGASPDAERWAGAPLDAVIGKELAARILGEEVGTLAGEGLKVGGEGLKRLYDVDFRNVIQGLPAVKKHGGRVTTFQLPGGREGDARMQAPIVGVVPDINPIYFRLVDANGRRQGGPYVTQADAEAGMAEWNARLQPMAVQGLTLTPALREAAVGGQALFQEVPRGAQPDRRGAIRFGADKQFLIKLLEHADASTFLHEMGHFFLEVFTDAANVVTAIPVAERTPMQVQLLADHAAATAWLVDDTHTGPGFSVRQHEQWARGFEAYLYEGKAPSVAMRGAFARYRAWLLGVYGSLQKFIAYLDGATMTPAVRGVMDRLLASDAAILEAEAHRGPPAMFTTAESAGMSEAQFALYTKTVVEAGRVARERLDRQILAEVRREQLQTWKTEKDAIAKVVRADLEAQPVYQALAAIQRGTRANGDPLIEGEETPPLKLSRAIIVERYGAGRLQGLPRPYVYTTQGGLDPDLVAELFGYSSGDALLTALAQAPSLKTAVEQETSRRMQATHPNLRLDGTLAAVAQAAVANEQRDAIIRAEMRALSALRRTVQPFVRAAAVDTAAQLAAAAKERDYERRWFEAETKLLVAMREGRKQVEIDALKTEVQTLRAAARGGAARVQAGIPSMVAIRDAARDRMARMPIRQIQPAVYWSASRRAAQEAIDAAAKQDFDGAIAAKTQELVQLALYREAERALADVASRARFAVSLTTTAARARLGLAGGAYRDQVDAILDRFGFGKLSQKALTRRVALRQWVASLEASGQDVDLPEELLDETRRVHYRELTVEAFIGITDGLQQIVHLARLKNTLLKNASGRSFAVVRDGVVASIREHTPARPKVLGFRPSDEKWRAVADWFASHTKLAEIVAALDGYVEGGPVWDAIMRPINAAADIEAVRKREAATAYAAIQERAYPGRALGTLHEKLFIPAIGDSLTHEWRLGVALNWGNQGGRDRLLADPVRQWTRPQIEAILDTLDQRDWEFVQATWDHLNTFWPEIAAKQERVTGLVPDKVEAVPVTTKFGEYAGGYYPLQYDPRLHVRAIQHEAATEAKLATSASYVRNTTKRGHVEARVARVQLPVRLELGVVYQHLEQVLHDLTHHEMLIDVTRILRDSQVAKAILETQGDIVYQQITRALQDITIGSTPPARNRVERAANFLRTGTQIAAMGWNLWTSAQQPLGLFNGMERVGVRWVAGGLKRWLRDAASMESTLTWIVRVSPMMRERATNGTQDLHDLRAKFRTAGGWFDNLVRGVTKDTITQQTITDGFLWHIGLMQRVADVPTWIGQYEKSRAAGEPEARAIALADQAVLDSQGGGQIKDLAQIQRGGAMARLYMTFYSYGNTVYNATARAAGQTNFKSPASVVTFLGHLSLLYVMPALASTTLSRLFGKSGDDDDDNDWEEYLLDVGQDVLAQALNTMLLVRELGGLVQDTTRGYEGPAGARVFTLLNKLGQQVKQGEVDDALLRALNATAGVLFRYPAGQVQRTIDGAVALWEGKTSNPAALLVGPSAEARK